MYGYTPCAYFDIIELSFWHNTLCFLLKYTFKRILKLFIILLIYYKHPKPWTKCSFKPKGILTHASVSVMVETGRKGRSLALAARVV